MPDKTVSAEVIMKSEGSTAVQHAAQWFQARGFNVEAAGPMSFSISGPTSTFREVLKMRGKTLKKPEDVPDDVDEVTFTPPPDFGPTSY